MSDNCNMIHIKEAELVIEFINSSNLLIEMERESNIIEILDCENGELQVDTDPISLEINQQQNFVLEIERPEILLEFPEHITIINNGSQLPSEDFEQVICTMEAGQTIQVNRVITLMLDGRVKHADKDIAEDAKDVIGVSITSAAIGGVTRIVKFGVIQGAAIGAIGDNFFLGNNGQIVNAPPTTGTWLYIGTQLTASTFLVKIGEPIRRN